MNRLILTALTVALLAGCVQQTPQKPAADRPAVQVEPVDQKVQANGGDNALGDPKVAPPPAGNLDQAPTAPAPVAADDKQEKFDAALNDALVLLADRKYAEALVAMEAARNLDDNDFIRGEIAKLKQRLEQDGAAKSAVQNIEAVLGEGKGGEAAQLTVQALKEFGGGADGTALVKLRLQADALATVQNAEDAAA
jgi:hypothetical protein